VVSLYGRVSKVGNTSIQVHIETMVERHDRPDEIKVTEGTFIYVAIDERGRPRPVPKGGLKGGLKVPPKE
jgi:acyl-CoA thioesterase YciA